VVAQFPHGILCHLGYCSALELLLLMFFKPMDHNGGSYLMLMLEERVTGIHTWAEKKLPTHCLA